MKSDPPQLSNPQDNKPDAAPRVGLQDIIQMECAERNSSVLEIYNETEMGRIYIQDGEITHAVIGHFQGERALWKLLDLPGGSFELVTFELPEERTIKTSWASLLNQALLTREEIATRKTAGDGSAGTVYGAARGTALQVAETLLCTPAGETLYEARCADVPTRKIWLQTVVQEARQLGQILPLGQFDRMDISSAEGRATARVRADSLAYVRVAGEKGGA